MQTRVSENGVASITALQIENATGRVALPATPTREVLDADRSYFVRVDGDDENSGMADIVEGAFVTIQYTVDAAASIDLAAFSVSEHVGAVTHLYASVLGTIQSPDGASYEITAMAFDRHACANLPGRVSQPMQTRSPGRQAARPCVGICSL